MKKIIIRTPNFIGDTINTTPCLELIKQEYPEAEFTIVGPDFVRELFKYDPRITHYITFPLKRKKKLSTYWKIVRELRKENGELGVIFVNTFISALLFRLGNVKKNIGYNREGRGFLLDFSPEINYHTVSYTHTPPAITPIFSTPVPVLCGANLLPENGKHPSPRSIPTTGTMNIPKVTPGNIPGWCNTMSKG